MRLPAFPGHGVEDFGAIGAQAGYGGGLFGRVVVARSRGCMRRFGEDAHHIVEVGHGAHPPVPPHAEVGGRDSPRHAQHGEAVGHGRAYQVHARCHPRVDIGVDRAAERRDEDPRPGRRGLVVVVDDLREPLPVEHLGDHLCLLHVVHEPVAVVVVAHVFLVEHRRRARLVRRAEVFAVPGHDELQPVGVDDRHEEGDDLVAHLLHLGRLFRGDAVGQLRRHLRRGAFCGVHARIKPDDRFALSGQLAGFCFRQTRRGEGRADLAVAVQAFEVFLRRDEQQLDRPSVGGLTDFYHLDPLGGSVQLLVKRKHLAVIGQFVIRPRPEPEDIVGLGHLGQKRELQTEEQSRQEQQSSQRRAVRRFFHTFPIL